MDVNKMSEDGSAKVSHDDQVWTDDGKLMFYQIQEKGSDWGTGHILDTTTMKTYPEKIEWLKFSNIEWLNDNSGFLYNRFDKPKSIKENK
jgi:prolyl oligopeptidase